MNTAELAQKVLAEIDAKLAQWERGVTKGPWATAATLTTIIGNGMTIADTYLNDPSGTGEPQDEHDAAFITESRTLLPKLAEGYKIAIEGLMKLTLRPSGDIQDDVCQTVDSYADDAEVALATLCEQWRKEASL